jgi:hypothetical protein
MATKMLRVNFLYGSQQLLHMCSLVLVHMAYRTQTAVPLRARVFTYVSVSGDN